MNYAPGSLVRVRGREWVVLPEQQTEDRLTLRPLDGSDRETVTIAPELESVTSATFALPDSEELGDARSCRLLRDAVRLGFRATGGPFRSFGHIAVEPRPYQLVPLLMALKQDPVRLLIADDVGIGKTIEAALIARELLDRGEVGRLAVLCPPQLAEQWQRELEDKFHIVAELVLPSTVRRLEKGLGVDESLFAKYPHTIVSIDYIKADRRRAEFLRACPELVIVDEAHACAGGDGRSAMQRHELVRELTVADKPRRHMIFVSATPHSGKEEHFRSLLSFLKPEFAELPSDLAGKEHEKERRALAEHFVQRRRGDIHAYRVRTPFPKRESVEITWAMSAEAKALFDKVVALAKDNIGNSASGTRFQQRVSWWSALALLRSVASSPEAAAATLRNRATGLDVPDDPDLLDELGRQAVFDLDDPAGGEAPDTVPGADAAELAGPDAEKQAYRKRLRGLADAFNRLAGDGDKKLKKMVQVAKKLLDEGFSPIIFCRFIDTADYLAEHLRAALRNVEVAAVTGRLPPEEREFRVRELGRADRRILVCTDCLSEGVNLQEHFNCVVHYDLSWNPTRHEQREGRVDRFGQPSSTVRVVNYYGTDNRIDGIVLDVLLRKHAAIRKSLGISVPIPEDSDKVMEAILEGLLLRGGQRDSGQQLLLPGLEDPAAAAVADRLASEWDNVAQRVEKRSRTLFAQQSIKVDDVALEMDAANAAAGNSADVEEFFSAALVSLGATEQTTDSAQPVRHAYNLTSIPPPLRRRLALPAETPLKAVFDLPVPPGHQTLSRTHPLVERLAAEIMTTALDPLARSPARRAGAMRTAAVNARTTLLLCRFRFQLTTTGGIEHQCLTEECALLAFAGAPEKAAWQDQAAAESLLKAEPAGNIQPEQARDFIARVTDSAQALMPHLREVMGERAQTLLEAHRRVRGAANIRGLQYKVAPLGEPDILGVYVFLPA